MLVPPMPKTYLQTTFKDREQVKNLGARWDPDRRQWFVPEGRDLTSFGSWLPAEHQTALSTQDSDASTELALPTKGVSLSQLMTGVAQAVARAYGAGEWVRAEVVKADARNGHVYLELAERSLDGDWLAQARAIMWANTANQILPAFERATGVVLGTGLKLLLHAKPTLSPQYGLSLVVDAIDPDYTLGDLEAKKREIRARLQREGLTELNRSLPAPWDYNAVLVVAPQGSAGLGDFQIEAERLQRCGVCRFVIVYSRFQGEGAAADVRQTLLQGLADWKGLGLDQEQPDAVVIIRGGGAVNDLAWLNDYELARCICELPVPVLTGIGHERDRTVLDEVAHTRFDTPSKVIGGIEQLIVRRTVEAREHFQAMLRLASQAALDTGRAVEQAHLLVGASARRQIASASERSAAMMSTIRVGAMQSVRDASELTNQRFFDVKHQAVAQVGTVRQAVPILLAEVHSEARQSLRAAQSDASGHLRRVLERASLDAQSSAESANRMLVDVATGARRIVAQSGQRSQAMMREIAGQGPEKTLGRGFAIVRASGKPVTSARDVANGAAIEVQFRDGRVAARAGDNQGNHSK